jgi:hypothetical protein
MVSAKRIPPRLTGLKPHPTFTVTSLLQRWADESVHPRTPFVHLANERLYRRHQFSVLLSGLWRHRGIDDPEGELPALKTFFGDNFTPEDKATFCADAEAYCRTEEGGRIMQEALDLATGFSPALTCTNWESYDIGQYPKHFMPTRHYRECSQCRHVQIEMAREDFDAACPVCSHPILPTQIRSFIEPKSFVTSSAKPNGRDPGLTRLRPPPTQEARLLSAASPR